jgi:hypothetical protein
VVGRWFRTVGIAAALFAGIAIVAASIAIPALFLLRADEDTLGRWAQIGEALSVVGVFFSGVAFLGIAFTLLLQQREIHAQREELSLLQEEQRRSSEIAVRQMHTDVIKMAIDDRELLSVWPPVAPGVAETRKDHYCNLILNLQKVAYETRTINLEELRGALRYLMGSRAMYEFWRRARAARLAVTAGDVAEDFFTAEVDRAFHQAAPPPRRPALAELLAGWWPRGR